jgi:hypothetical protein
MARPEVTGRKTHSTLVLRKTQRVSEKSDDDSDCEPEKCADDGKPDAASSRAKAKAKRKTSQTVALAAFSIQQFCEAHGISIDLYFKLQRQGLGPKTIKAGTRTLISIEAAAEWRRARELA